MLSVITKGVLILSTVIMGSVTLSVANKPFMLSVVMLNVVAPCRKIHRKKFVSHFIGTATLRGRKRGKTL